MMAFEYTSEREKLKRELRDLGLKRKAGSHDEDTVPELLKQEMQGAGSLAGYRYIQIFD